MHEKMKNRPSVRCFLSTVIIFCMIAQGMPLAQLSWTFKWHFESERVGRIINLLGPSEANAAPPVAEAGADQQIVKNGLLSGTVFLDGSDSFDPEGGSYATTWYGPFGTAAGATPSVTVPQGVYTILLQAMGCPQNAGTDTVEITVIQAFTISARSKMGKVQLTWTHLPEAAHYDVYRSIESDPFSFKKSPRPPRPIQPISIYLFSMKPTTCTL